MFKSEDFELSLEKQLKLRVIDDDIDNCNDIDTLKQSLKEVTAMLMKYQHLLNVTLTAHIAQECKNLLEKGLEETS